MSAKKPDANSATHEHTIPMGYAISIIVIVLVVIFGLFVAPLFIAIKIYLFMAVCIAVAFGLKYNKTYGTKTPKESSTFSTVEYLTLVITMVAIFWCGAVKFIQYWFPGGAEPYFHDLSAIYTAALVPLIVCWGAALLYSADKKTIRSLIWCFRVWTYGYLAMFGLILFLLIVFEGD